MHQQKKIKRQAQSTVDDIVFVVTKGRNKPRKHLCVGMGLKSITGSRRVLDVSFFFVSVHDMKNDDIAENVGQHGQPKMQNKAPERFSRGDQHWLPWEKLLWGQGGIL